MTLFSCQFLVRALFFVSFTVIVTQTQVKKEGRGGAAVSVIWWRMCGQLPDKLNCQRTLTDSRHCLELEAAKICQQSNTRVALFFPLHQRVEKPSTKQQKEKKTRIGNGCHQQPSTGVCLGGLVYITLYYWKRFFLSFGIFFFSFRCRHCCTLYYLKIRLPSHEIQSIGWLVTIVFLLQTLWSPYNRLLYFYRNCSASTTIELNWKLLNNKKKTILVFSFFISIISDSQVPQLVKREKKKEQKGNK